VTLLGVKEDYSVTSTIIGVYFQMSDTFFQVAEAYKHCNMSYFFLIMEQKACSVNLNKLRCKGIKCPLRNGYTHRI
jgi:hypothetical protein